MNPSRVLRAAEAFNKAVAARTRIEGEFQAKREATMLAHYTPAAPQPCSWDELKRLELAAQTLATVVEDSRQALLAAALDDDRSLQAMRRPGDAA